MNFFDVRELLGLSIFLGVKQMEAVETATFTLQMEVSTIRTNQTLSVTSFATTISFKSRGSGKKGQNLMTTKDGTT